MRRSEDRRLHKRMTQSEGCALLGVESASEIALTEDRATDCVFADRLAYQTLQKTHCLVRETLARIIIVPQAGRYRNQDDEILAVWRRHCAVALGRAAHIYEGLAGQAGESNMESKCLTQSCWNDSV